MLLWMAIHKFQPLHKRIVVGIREENGNVKCCCAGLYIIFYHI